MAYRSLQQAMSSETRSSLQTLCFRCALVLPGQAQQAADAVATEVARGCSGASRDSNGSSSNGMSADSTAPPAVILCGDMNAEPDSAACQVSSSPASCNCISLVSVFMLKLSTVPLLQPYFAFSLIGCTHGHALCTRSRCAADPETLFHHPSRYISRICCSSVFLSVQCTQSGRSLQDVSCAIVHTLKYVHTGLLLLLSECRS